jgi:hypothetical protein
MSQIHSAKCPFIPVLSQSRHSEALIGEKCLLWDTRTHTRRKRHLAAPARFSQTNIGTAKSTANASPGRLGAASGIWEKRALRAYGTSNDFDAFKQKRDRLRSGDLQRCLTSLLEIFHGQFDNIRRAPIQGDPEPGNGRNKLDSLVHKKGVLVIFTRPSSSRFPAASWLVAQANACGHPQSGHRIHLWCPRRGHAG